MNKKSKCNGKHLTISDRLYIEQELLQGSSFRSIASVLGKDPTTISKEIRLHCDNTDSYRFKGCHRCKFFKKISLCLRIMVANLATQNLPIKRKVAGTASSKSLPKVHYENTTTINLQTYYTN